MNPFSKHALRPVRARTPGRKQGILLSSHVDSVAVACQRVKEGTHFVADSTTDGTTACNFGRGCSNVETASYGIYTDRGGYCNSASGCRTVTSIGCRIVET